MRTSGATRNRSLFNDLAGRLTLLTVLLVAAGWCGMNLVRMAPGLGMDERLLDPRLAGSSRSLIEKENIARSIGYLNYLKQLMNGDLGVSTSLGRPVRELLTERVGVSLRSAAGGLGGAWLIGLAAVAWLEVLRRRPLEAGASALAGTLLCVPAAVVALLCVSAGGAPSLALTLILLPRLFRYLRNLAAAACRAPHVFAARAYGLAPARVLAVHIAGTVWPEVLALAGVSVSMAVSAAIPVEALCDSPGVGQLVWRAALARDIPVLVNVTLIITAITATANLVADTIRARRLEEV